MKLIVAGFTLLTVFALAGAGAWADSVVCEPQGQGTTHPPLYWYEVWAMGDWI